MTISKRFGTWASLETHAQLEEAKYRLRKPASALLIVELEKLVDDPRGYVEKHPVLPDSGHAGDRKKFHARMPVELIDAVQAAATELGLPVQRTVRHAVAGILERADLKIPSSSRLDAGTPRKE